MCSQRECPLIVFPEGVTTNGKGMLMFNKFIFGLGEEIQPVAIRLKPCVPLPVHFDYLTDTIWGNLFTLFFHPYTVLEYNVLTRQVSLDSILLTVDQHILPGEKPEEFAARVQSVIADHLGIPATTFTYK